MIRIPATIKAIFWLNFGVAPQPVFPWGAKFVVGNEALNSVDLQTERPAPTLASEDLANLRRVTAAALKAKSVPMRSDKVILVNGAELWMDGRATAGRPDPNAFSAARATVVCEFGRALFAERPTTPSALYMPAAYYPWWTAIGAHPDQAAAQAAANLVTMEHLRNYREAGEVFTFIANECYPNTDDLPHTRLFCRSMVEAYDRFMGVVPRRQMPIFPYKFLEGTCRKDLDNKSLGTGQIQAILDEFAAAGVTRLAVSGCDLNSNLDAKQAQQFAEMF